MNRFIVAIALIYGAYYYVSKNYKFEDTLKWAKTHAGSPKAAKVEYYVGLAYYQRADYPKAQEAFLQLLQAHATSEYLADALVRLEDSAEGNHDWEVARLAVDTYLEVQPERFPKHKSLEIMRTRAEQLKMRGH